MQGYAIFLYRKHYNLSLPLGPEDGSSQELFNVGLPSTSGLLVVRDFCVLILSHVVTISPIVHQLFPLPGEGTEAQGTVNRD